jgi:hypothetical protein
MSNTEDLLSLLGSPATAAAAVTLVLLPALHMAARICCSAVVDAI